MKYLITAEPGPTPMPPEQGVALLQVSKAWMEAKLADGSLDMSYNFFGGGGFAIGNADSHEELLSNLLEYPMYPFFVWEVTPILDWGQSFDKYIEFYERIASMVG